MMNEVNPPTGVARRFSWVGPVQALMEKDYRLPFLSFKSNYNFFKNLGSPFLLQAYPLATLLNLRGYR